MSARVVVLTLAVLAVASCGVPQAPECERYVACQAAYDSAFEISPRTPTADYDEGGRCWFGNLETAQTCTRNCLSTTEALGEAASAAGQPLDACEG